MLADRGNRCSAVCVPVTLSGRSVGVVHVTGAPHEPPPAEVVDELLALAGQVGGRVDAIRTLESTIRQARTDVLTGLPNRRAFEQRASDLLGRGTPFVLVVADLDRFKAMNDTYGHEFGDRALQLFAEVVQGNARPQDTVARFGGEEFVFAYPEISIRQSVEVIERLRTRLADAIARAEFPPFTCSFGVCHSSAGDTVDGLVRIADAGLMMAKENGRDRVVIADRDLAAEVFH
jgi:diguanylate cyclase (GGDEF)-like protein